MATALLRVMLQNGLDPKQCVALRRSLAKTHDLSALGVQASTDVLKSVVTADIIFLGIRPQQLDDLFGTQKTPFSERQLLVSMLAGVQVDRLQTVTSSTQIVRIMPNLACTVGQGVVGCYVSPTAVIYVEILKILLTTFGRLVMVQEECHLDLITAISGSGIAYFYQLSLALQQVAQLHGMDLVTAQQTIDATLVGAGALLAHAMERDVGTESLVVDIAVAGGTTEHALSVFTRADALAVLCQEAVSVVLSRCQLLNQHNRDSVFDTH